MDIEHFVRKRIKYYKDNQQYKLLDKFEKHCEELHIFLIDEGNGLENSKFFILTQDFFKDYFSEYIYLYESKRYFVWYKELFEKRERPSIHKKIPKSKNKIIKKRDRYTCPMCGDTINLTIDHIYPWSIYHDSSFYNLVTLCRTCNENKADSILYSDALRKKIIEINKKFLVKNKNEKSL